MTNVFNCLYSSYNFSEAVIQTNGFKTLLDYPDDFQFDLIVHDFAPGPCLLGFVHKFKNPPLIAATAFGNPPHITALIGGHQYYSYVPHTYLEYGENMDIFQRMYNFVIYMVELL